MELTTKRRETLITLDGTQYVLRELDGAGRDEFLQYTTRNIRLDENGKPELTNNDLRGQSAMLISMSLLDPEKNFAPAFSKETIQTWSSSTIEELYKESARLSGLDRRAKETAKNA